MSKHAAAGPYKTLALDGADVPLYVVPFDETGACTAPETRAALLEALAGDRFTDVFLFSHGWNNDWATATARYESFARGMASLRADLGLSYGRPVRPLLVGVFWPSTALVLPSEAPPAMAAVGSDVDAEGTAAEREELLRELPAEQRARAAQLLASAAPLDRAALLELAGFLAPLWNRWQHAGSGGSDLRVEPVTAGELADLWQPAADDDDEDDDPYGGRIDAPSRRAAPEAALSWKMVMNAPRDLLRGFTVLRMKDRAATVGRRGVAALLRDVGTGSTGRLHLVGHSYGCIVLLSALASEAAAALPRQVASVLLLQAAVSRYCFAEKVPGKTYGGGYRPVLDRVTQPILLTFTRRDLPLRELFHLAARRDVDLGQPGIAAPLVPAAPSLYAALGGYGPAGCAPAECRFVPIHGAGEPYDLSPGAARVIALNADETVQGHGDISVSATWWALYCQVLAA